jgi:peptidoglycan/LPS O-acetylase OafA/YrhL
MSIAGTAPVPQRFFWFDWLRFIAAFLVLLYHARGTCFAQYGDFPADDRGPLLAVFFALTRVGPEAVLLFFVLSGYLVGGQAIIGRLREGRFNKTQYVIDRLTRVYVPFVPALVLTMVIGLFVHQPITWVQFAGCLVGLHESWIVKPEVNQALWSLAYEIWFYVLGGAVVMVATSSSSRLRIFGWMLINAGLVVFTKLDVMLLIVWLLGALAYTYRPTASGRIEMLAAAFLVIAGVLGYQLDRDSASLDSRAWQAWVPPHRLGMVLLGVGCALGASALARWEPSSAWLRKFERAGGPLAAFSYTLYLVHTPLLALFSHAFSIPRMADASPHSLAVFALMVTSCLIIAWLL